MKLYRILVLHGGFKSSHTATETFLVAENDEQVANWIQAEKCHGLWLDDEEGEEPNVRYADDLEKEISFRDWVMLNHGDLDDDEGWEDAHYGVTKWGWEEVAGATQQDIERFIELGIAIPASQD